MPRDFLVVLIASIGGVHGFECIEATAQSLGSHGQLLSYELESGKRPNATSERRRVFHHVIAVPDAMWIRVHFSELALEGTSKIRLTSLTDGEVQKLDAASAAQWSSASAYFNGDRVLVELLAAPRSTKCQVTINQIEVELPQAASHAAESAEGASGQCGICGPDDRVPSNENWSARLMPVGCTASIYNSCSHMVSAGHCVSTGMVAQFNVPNSQSDCGLVNPPVADQFPITSFVYAAVDIGNDWAVLTTGTNSAGQRPFDRYGQYRPIASAGAVNGQPIALWGYGMDDVCSESQRQQTCSGNVDLVQPSYFQFFADVRTGNSGTAVIRGGEIVGIVTNCMEQCPNVASSVSIPAFAAARSNLASCTLEPCAADVTGDLVVNMFDLLQVIQHWGTCPVSPAPCVGNIALNLPPSVDIQDLLAVVNNWGNCSGHIGPGGL